MSERGCVYLKSVPFDLDSTLPHSLVEGEDNIYNDSPTKANRYKVKTKEKGHPRCKQDVGGRLGERVHATSGVARVIFELSQNQRATYLYSNTKIGKSQ